MFFLSDSLLMLYAVINAGGLFDLRCLDLYEDLELSVIELLMVRARNVERKSNCINYGMEQS